MYSIFVYFKNLYLKMKNSLKVKNNNYEILWSDIRLKGYTLNDGKERTQNELTFKEGKYFDYPSSVTHEFNPICNIEMENDIERIKELMGISNHSIIPVQPMGLPSGMLHYIDNNGIDTLESSDKLIDEKNRRLVNYKMSQFPNIKRDIESNYNPYRIEQDYY